MRLKKLTLCGFKSFADKTDISFDASIACIVGPNGCGKSNIVDAIKWVLGEQSAKSLRGGAMLDVIFNGSGTRRPSGMATVSLTFENTDRCLALDFDQVTVTRQLYRDGSSQYLLNDKRCRLRDVRELFMDTGIGTDAYSIIEQGKVDVLLQANPLQRREIFEEAAGISKFKARKLDACRKLERTQQNLGLIHERVNDAQRRLRSVKIQASRARSYQEHAAQLRQLQLTYSLARYHQIQTRLQQVNVQLEQSQVQRATAAAHMNDCQEQLSQAERDRQTITAEQKQIEHDRFTQRSLNQQAQQRLQFTRTALADLQRQIEADQHRRDELSEQADRLRREQDEQTQQSQRLKASQRDTDVRLQEAQAQHRALGHQLNETRSTLEDEKAGIVGLMRRSAQIHNEIQSIGVFEQNLIQTRQKLGQRADHVAQELEQLLTSRDEATQKHAEVQQLLEAQQLQLRQHTDQASQLDDQQQQLSVRLAAQKEQRSALDSRRAVLQEMQDKQQGVADPIKAILAHKDAARRTGGAETFGFVRGLLAQMIETDPDQPDHARIVEAALGDYQHALVIDQLTDICGLAPSSQTISALAGRVTFLPIDQFSQTHQDNDEPSANDGVEPVINLVRYGNQVAPIVRQLLGRTLVVADLATAADLRAQRSGNVRFVTTKGELVEDDGRVTAGPVNGANSATGGLISRRGELVRLQRQITQLDQTIQQDQQQLAGLGDRAAHVEKLSQDLRHSIYEANADRIELASRMENLNGQIAQLQREQPVLAAETQQIHRQLHDANQKRTTHQREATKLEEDSTSRQQAVAQLETTITELSQAAETAHEALISTRVEVGKLAEQASAIGQQIRQLEIASADIQRQQNVLHKQLQQHHEKTDQLEQGAFDAKKQVEESDARLKELDVRYDLVHHRLQKADAVLDELRSTLAGHQHQIEALDKQIHGLEVTQRELEVKAEAIGQQSLEQLSIQITDAYRQYEPQEIDWPAIEAQIKDLRGKLDRLGTVNLDAIGEQDELEATCQQLGQQVQDIETARSQLEQLIRQIDADSRSRFEAIFGQLRENFAGRDGLFRRLFGGGRADLVLVPDDQGHVNVLESGIDIIAKPPGKEPRSISLLSGGEKTMTAVALLMSIFKAKPSPFCVLDEVDAALDEANLDRFSQVINGFLDRSHFVIITHQKRTMQAADQLYGITMQERGVSKRVAVRFEQVGANGQIHKDAIGDASTPEPLSHTPTTAAPDHLEPGDTPTGTTNSQLTHGRDEKPSKPRRSPSRRRLAAMLDANKPVGVKAGTS